MADTRRYVYIAFFTVNVYIKKGRILYILHFKISVSDIYFPHRIGNSYFWPIKCQASLISEFQWSITHADLDLLSNGLSTCIATKPQKLLFCNEGKMCSVSDYRRSNLKKREEGKKKKGRRKNGKFGSFFMRQWYNREEVEHFTSTNIFFAFAARPSVKVFWR